MRKILTLLAAALLVVGCSVKEDRSDCPCWLVIDLSKNHGDKASLMGWGLSDLFAEDGVPVKDYPEGYLVEVPRGDIEVAVWSGVLDCRESGRDIVAPRGTQFDELWLATGEVDCTGEDATFVADQHKQWCELTVKVIAGDDDPVDPTELGVVVSSSWAGVCVSDGSPVKGDFEVSRAFGRDGTLTVRIPRQGGPGLEMGLYMADRLGVWQRVRTVDLYELLREIGYDWNALDLDDATVTLMMGQTDMLVTLLDWEGLEKRRYEI